MKVICNKIEVIKIKVNVPLGRFSHIPSPVSGLKGCCQSSFEHAFSVKLCVHVDKLAAFHLASQTVAFPVEQGLL